MAIVSLELDMSTRQTYLEALMENTLRLLFDDPSSTESLPLRLFGSLSVIGPPSCCEFLNVVEWGELVDCNSSFF